MPPFVLFGIFAPMLNTNTTFLKHLLAVFCVFVSSISVAQQQGSLMDLDLDSTRKMFNTWKTFDGVRFNGYIQPQFQVTRQNGARSFNGGDFAPNVSNRFMLRRGRFRISYTSLNKNKEPTVNFVFQFDGTERGVFIRDFWGRFYEHRFNLFSFSMGMLPRPFGFEVNLSSSDREALERGRMSQILMRTERDLGFMVTMESSKAKNWLRHLKLDVGIFNGQGLTATADFDNHKDLISRLSMKPVKINKSILSGSISGFLGGMEQFTPTIYRVENTRFKADSTTANLGKIAPRRYWGGDVQFKIPNRKGFTELRAEYIFGQQTATFASSESPGTIPTANGRNAPLYVRHFNGAYFYFLQHLGSTKYQFVMKYDWYDPNTRVSGKQLGEGFSWADIRYNTLGVGLIHHLNDNLKATLWYEMPTNEATSLSGYTTDQLDNNFTCRLQYRF